MNMQTAIERILEFHGLLKAYQRNPNFCVKLENPGYMDLIINRLPGFGKEGTVSIAHYFQQNGDAVPDPDILFALPDWAPVEYQDSLSYTQDAGRIAAFASSWAQNLLDQGWDRRSKVKKRL